MNPTQRITMQENRPKPPKIQKFSRKCPRIPGTFRNYGIAQNAEKTFRNDPSPPRRDKRVSCTGTRLRQSDQTGTGTPKCDTHAGRSPFTRDLRAQRAVANAPPIPIAARCGRPRRARNAPVVIADTHKQIGTAFPPVPSPCSALKPNSVCSVTGAGLWSAHSSWRPAGLYWRVAALW